MKLDFSPQVVVRRLPPRWADRYARYMGSEPEPDSLDSTKGLRRTGFVVIAVFFGLVLVWGAFAPLSGAAVATGVVKVAGNRQALQTLNGGVVEQVLVKEGDAVRAGQVLIRMNGLAAGGRLQQSQAQKDALRAAEARLIAERDRSPSLGFPSDLASRSSEPTVRQAIANQTALFESRKRVFDAERQISEARVQQARARAEAPSRQLVFVRDQLAGMRALYEKGFATKARLYDLERMQIELETNNTSGAAALAEARLVAARDEQARMGEVIDQLRQVQSQLSQVDPQVAVARYNAERDVVRAPVAGAVVGMQDVAAGGILSPGQRIADLLPAGRALIVEARIKPEDVDDVRVGSEAHVRFTTVNPRGRSNITGRVTVLSADRLTDPATGTAYYLAYIALDGAQLERDGVQLSAGLPATVNIKTKSRSFLNYLLAPLMDSFSKAGREE